MTYVVTSLCRDCKDTSCAKVCPVDCFYEPKAPGSDLPDQLYIDPNECIDCNLCVAECPWEAIFAKADVPDVFQNCIALNALSTTKHQDFQKAVQLDWGVCSQCGTKTPDDNPRCGCKAKLHKYSPSSEEIEANKERWGHK